MSLKSFFGMSGNKEISAQEKWDALQKSQATAHDRLFKAIRQEDTAAIDQILKEYPEATYWKDTADDNGRPLLHYALQKNRLKSFTHMLEIGIDPRQSYRYTYALDWEFALFFIPDKLKGRFTALEAACIVQKKDFVFNALQRLDRQSVSSNARLKKNPVIENYLNRADEIRAEYLQEKKLKEALAEKEKAAPVAEKAKETPPKPLMVKSPATVATAEPAATSDPLQELMKEFNALKKKQAATEERLKAAEKELQELKDPGAIVKIPNQRQG